MVTIAPPAPTAPRTPTDAPATFLGIAVAAAQLDVATWPQRMTWQTPYAPDDPVWLATIVARV